MIENIYYQGRELKFLTSDFFKFDGLFPFGSLNLLIGINGSGKTTMLLQAAKIISVGADFGDEGNYSFLDSDGTRKTRDAKYPLDDYGVVYYTPIPYRRTLKTGKKLIDASSKKKNGASSASINNFREISSMLGQETHLFGSVSYRLDIVEKIFMPFLVESDVKLYEVSLDKQLKNLRSIYSHGLPSKIPNRPLPNYRRENVFEEGDSVQKTSLRYEGERGYTDEEIEITRDFIREFSGFLHSILDHKGNSYRIAALSTLQKYYALEENKNSLMKFFMEFHHMSIDMKNLSTGGRNFMKCFENTLKFLNRKDRGFDGVGKVSENMIEFSIASDELHSEILLSETAIELGWSGLSSGLQALIEQFSNIEVAIERLCERGLKKIVLLIDEGDAFLHLDWQRKYIYLISIFLRRMKFRFDMASLQVLIATHSPILAGDLPRCMVQNIGFPDSTPKTFGAALDDIVFQCFHSNSVGEFAALTIRDIYSRAKAGMLTKSDYNLIEEIGDPSLQSAILNAMESSNDR